MSRSRLPRAVLTAALLATAVAGCGSSAGAKAGAAPSAGSAAVLSGRITVFAAASLTEAFKALGTQFEQAHPGTTVTFDFGASSTLATQITQGAPADVFASAAKKNMDDVDAAGLVVSPTPFAANTGEIAVPKGNPAHVASVADLAKPGVKVALCQAEVPCGKLAAQVFTKAGVTVDPVTREADVKATLTKVQLGEVDAGVVYVTDVRAATGKVDGVPIPAEQNAKTTYPIAVVKASKSAALATAFEQYVLSPQGQSVLTSAGFASP